jgi:hypothetical protein
VTSSVPTNGIQAPATGISAHDYEIDRIVGADAEGKWKRIAARQKDKLSYMQETGAEGRDLMRLPDGSYAVMDASDRELSERGRSFASKMDAEFLRKYPIEQREKIAPALEARRLTGR